MAVELHEDQPLPDPEGSLEGTYRTWTLAWSRVFAAGLDVEVAFIDNRGNLYQWIDVGTRMRVYDITGTEIYSPGAGTWMIHTPRFYKSWSVLERYHMVWDRFLGGLWRVVEWGVEIFTRDPTIDEANVTIIEGCAISPDGHYICVICEHTVGGDDRIMLIYEGV